MEEKVKVPAPPQAPAASGGGLEVGSSMPTASVPNRTVRKVIVAVHGIGDQYSFATIQSVVNQFCLYYGQPAAVPLGNFHSGQPAYTLSSPYPPVPFASLAFGEVYWAPIARDAADEKHTLEEAKRWARTIVERLRLRWHEEEKKKHSRGAKPNAPCQDKDFHLTQQVLGEMIQTIAVVERICFLADRAGLFTFDLRKLLDDYLGDVQIVAEFKSYRDKILEAFANLMESVKKAFPEAEIYLVAHSEGTVVAFLGLLQAFREIARPDWTRNVRGLMTLGSPIDKHLALWPELFGDSPPSGDSQKEILPKIEWRNYYDFGDPVGFNLDSIREWIEVNGWQSVFNFDGAKDDIGFTRYPFPGKAHVDYWADQDVFGHFISTVVKEIEAPLPDPAPPKAAVKRSEPRPVPASLTGNKWLSYLVPYAGVFTLLFLAAYVLYKAISEATGHAVQATSLIFVRSAGLAALVYGIAVVARIPRLTYSTFWRATSFALAGLGALLYMWSMHEGKVVTFQSFSIPPGGITLALALLVAALTFAVSVKRPSWGLAPLIVAGTLAVATVVGHHLLISRTDQSGPVWPVFLATAAFLYLWWLAALLFDLVFIWHLYIRHSNLMTRINRVLGTYKERSGKSEAPRPASTVASSAR